jgi:hypothetical protein
MRHQYFPGAVVIGMYGHSYFILLVSQKLYGDVIITFEEIYMEHINPTE